MAAVRARRKLILAKIEANSGTAIAATADDAVLVSAASLTPVTGGTADRELMRPYFGASDSIPVNTHQQLEFSCEIAGPGSFVVADAAIRTPEWGKLLRACGMSETLRDKPGTDPANNDQVVYSPITGGEPSLTLRANWDGQEHLLPGARGTARALIAAKQIPRFAFTFTGLWSDPGPVALLNPSYSDWKAPRPGSTRDTPVGEFFGAARRLVSLELDWGNEVTHREVIGATNEVVIVDRRPSGTIVLDAQALDGWDPFATAAAGTTSSLRILHGGPAAGSAGKLVELKCPKIQLGEPTYGEEDGVLQFSIPFRALPENGNDEIEVIVQ